MSNPTLFVFNGNGSLAFQDRAGGGTLTGSGAVRYRTAENARTNYFTNPSLASGQTGWEANASSVTRTADSDFRYGYCVEVVEDTINQGLKTGGSGTIQIRDRAIAGQTFTVSFSAKLISGASDWKIQAFGSTPDGTAIGGNTATAFTSVPTLTRHVLTFIAAADVGAHGFALYFRRASSAASVIRISDVLVEFGTTDGSWFDPVWLDPLTGILGTAHASPSVSQAVPVTLEGLTNTDNDPVFGNATITNYHAAVGSAVMTRLTTFAGLGSASGEAACTASTSDGMEQLSTTGAAAATAQTWTFNGHIRAKASGDVGKTVIPVIVERTSGDVEVLANAGSAITLTDAPQEFSFTATLSGGGTVAKVTWRLLNGAASVSTFVLLDKQLANKSVAHPVCFGSAGTGDAWSGTANASTSVRTQTLLNTPVTAYNIKSSSGAYAIKVRKDYISGTNVYAVASGVLSAGQDSIAIRYSSGGVEWSAIAFKDGSSAGTITMSPAPVIGQWTNAYMAWDLATVYTQNGSGSLQSTARTTPNDVLSSNINLGSSQTGAALSAISFGPFAIFSRPLTTRERAILNASPLWYPQTLARERTDPFSVPGTYRRR